jgi:4'-phosphopantetheinyl transferase
MRPDLDIMPLAHRYFAVAEGAALAAMAHSQRSEAFHRIWTLKEAYLKARGEGLSYGLDRFTVSCDPDRPARLLQDSWDPHAVAVWCLEELALGPGYRAATAIGAPNRITRLWQWQS